MKDSSKIKQALTEELTSMRRRIQELEQSEADRKKTEEARSDTEILYRLLFEHSPDGIVIIDPASARIIAFNETAHLQLGYSREEFAPLCISDFDVLETPEETRVTIADVIQKGRKDFETRHRTRLGEIRDVHVTAQFTEFLGKPVYHCVWRDITELKRVEKALRESEERYTKLMDNLPDIIVHTDLNGKVLFVNDSGLRMSGYGREEIIGQNMLSFIVPEDREEAVRNTILMFEKKLGPREYHLIMKDGRELLFEVNGEVLYNEEGSPYGTVQICRDISDRMRTEESLQKANKLQSVILDNSTVGIGFVRNRIFEWVNPRMPQLFGLPQEQFQGASTRIIYPNDEAYERLGAEAYPLLAQGEKATFEIEMRKGDGSSFWCRLEGNALDASKPHDGSIWIWEDITDRKQAQDRLVSSEKMLRELNELQGLLLQPNSIEQKLKLVTDAIVQIVGADFARIWMIKPGDHCQSGCIHAQILEGPHICRFRDRCLHLMASSGRYTHTDGRDHSRVPFGAYKIGKIAAGEEFKFLTNEVTSDPLVHNHTWAKELGLVSFVGYRLLDTRGTPSGVLALFGRQAITTEEDILLQGIADTTSQVLQTVRVEEALRESQAFYHSLVNQLPAGVFRKDQEGRFVFVSPWFCRFKEMKEEEFLGKTPQEVIVYETAKSAPKKNTIKYSIEGADHHVQIMQTGKPIELVEEYTDCVGGKQFVHVIKIPVFNFEGKVIGSQGIMFDITESKRVEYALRESQQQLSDIIEFLPDATYVIDKDEKVIAWNRAMETMTGIQKEDMIGKGNKEYAIPLYGYRRPVLIDLALHPDKEYEKEYTSIQRTGDIIFGEAYGPSLPRGAVHLSANASVLRDSKGEIIAAIECLRDNTERKRLEERLQRAEKLEALGKLAGGVAHDLNNVLGILSGYSELLLMEIPEGHRSRGHAEKILQSTEKGAAIIQDLLTLARRGVTASDVINLNSVVSGFLKTPVFEKMKDYHPRVTFTTECDQNLLNIKGSSVHLEKTLMNLVSNAAESISGKGEVTIRTESRYLDKPVRGYDEVKEGDYAVLTVSDTGMGIPAESREKIFEPFYTKKTMGRSGTGLGLAIVWGTVKDHNGYVDLQTEVGEGTTFTLYFPVTREEQIASQQTVPMEQYIGKGESVLVVDDIAEQRDVASRLLTQLGYEVHVVSGGEEAVEYLKENKADILVLDMIMAPGIDGLETYERILKVNPNQKAILVSGFSETERVKEAQRLGAGNYVKKPYIMEKIGLAIREELNR